MENFKQDRDDNPPFVQGKYRKHEQPEVGVCLALFLKLIEPDDYSGQRNITDSQRGMPVYHAVVGRVGKNNKY